MKRHADRRYLRGPFLSVGHDTPHLVLAAAVFVLVGWLPVTELLPLYHNVLCRSWTWDHGAYGTSTLRLCLWQGEDHSIIGSLVKKFWTRHFLWVAWWSAKLFLFFRRRWRPVLRTLPTVHPVITPRTGGGGYRVDVANNEYSTLRGSEVRLLYFEYDSPDVGIICRLKVVNINQRPRFNALSYAWRHQCAEQGSHIRVNGRVIPVLPNLYACLRQVHASRYTAALFVDSICINQSDTYEKGQQVTLMKDIYRSAQQVVVWLGELGQYGRQGMEMIATIADSDTDVSEASALGLTRAVSLEPRRPFPRLLNNIDTTEQNWVALSALLTRTYWRRLWVVQEVLLSDNAVLMCGNLCIDLSCLAGCVQRLAQSQLWTSPSTQKLLARSELKKAAALAGRYRRLRTLPRTLARLVHSRNNNNKHVAADFLHAADMCRGRDTTDERDRIFGVLGIAPLPITPSYNVTKLEAFMIATKSVIETCGTLDILAIARTSHEDSDLNSPHGRWPSWVPDWSELVDRDTSFSMAFFAAGNTPAQTSLDGNILSALGVDINQVHAAPHSSLQETPKEFAEQVRQEYGRCLQHIDLTSSRDDLKTSFLKATMARYGEIPPSGKGLSDPSSSSPEYWPWNDGLDGAYDMESPTFLQTVATRLDDIISSINNASSKTTSSFFVDAEGRLGWGPAGVRPGDRIVVLFGCRMPLVLRADGYNFRLGGSCYLDGAMYGERLNHLRGREEMFRLV